MQRSYAKEGANWNRPQDRSDTDPTPNRRLSKRPDLNALFLNCTLKRSPELSHTEGLIRISQAIMERNGVSVEVIRPVDYNIAYGVLFQNSA